MVLRLEQGEADKAGSDNGIPEHGYAAMAQRIVLGADSFKRLFPAKVINHSEGEMLVGAAFTPS